MIAYTVSLLLKILFIFYDAWIESDVVQTKFIKTYKPEKVTVLSLLRFLVMTNFTKWQTISQMLTGCKVNFREHGVEYKKNVIDLEAVNKMYQNYIEEIQWDNI